MRPVRRCLVGVLRVLEEAARDGSVEQARGRASDSDVGSREELRSSSSERGSCKAGSGDGGDLAAGSGERATQGALRCSASEAGGGHDVELE